MEFRPVTDDYAVSGQIEADDVAEIKEAGFKSIVCHRPDGEQPGQPSAADVGTSAAAAGLGFRHIPIRSGEQVPAEAVAAMRRALDELPGPVFAYCRSGARSTNIFSLARYG